MGDPPASHHHDAAAQLFLLFQDGVADGDGAGPDGEAGCDPSILKASAKEDFLRVLRMAASFSVSHCRRSASVGKKSSEGSGMMESRVTKTF
ncbi:MAG: hypothetical protein NT087_09260 [Deltaproteobacteria bacterium]|nr:hypothetical protein [Deltaproteobacteria bacterium]